MRLLPPTGPKTTVPPRPSQGASPRRPRAPRGLLHCLLGLIGLIAAGPAHPAAGLTEPVSLTFFDVGRGDALLIHQPDRCAVLIDAGPPGRGRALAAALARKGISRLDRLIVSHPHQDHFGGVLALPSGLAIGEVNDNGVDNAPERHFPAYRDWRARQRYRPLQKGDRWQCGEILFTVLGADRLQRPVPAINDTSLVLRLDIGPVGLLLPGDLEPEGQKALAAHAGQLDVEIFKVPHHGAADRHLGVWLERISPELSVISTGGNTPLDAPDLKTLQDIEQMSGRIWRTDLQGDLNISIDERGWHHGKP